MSACGIEWMAFGGVGVLDYWEIPLRKDFEGLGCVGAAGLVSGKAGVWEKVL